MMIVVDDDDDDDDDDDSSICWYDIWYDMIMMDVDDR